MMNLLRIFIGILSLSFGVVNAQSNHFEIEIDPLAYALGGASGHMAYTFKNERIQLGYGQLQLPQGLQYHEGIKEKFKSVSLKWDYFFGREDPYSGFFVGPTVDYLILSYERGSAIFKDDQMSIGLRGGYRIDLFKNSNILDGLYLTPWIGASWLTDSGDIRLDDQYFNRKSLNIFPTIHLGWSF